MRMLHDQVNPDRDAEARYLRARTYVLCFIGEAALTALTMAAGAALGIYIFC